MATGLATLLGVVLAACVPGGCDQRAAGIRARLSPAERQLFDRGARVAGECWSCHELAGPAHKIGPSLLGVFGRPAGSAEGFGGYSQAMRESGIVWSRRSLARFLSDPQGTVPGTTMLARPVRDPQAVAALLFYLREMTRPPEEAP